MAQTLKWGGTGLRSTSPKTQFMQRSWGWDVVFPGTWPVDAWFFRTDLNTPYQNTGTEQVPVFAARGGSLADHKHTAISDGGKFTDASIITISGLDMKVYEAMLL